MSRGGSRTDPTPRGLYVAVHVGHSPVPDLLGYNHQLDAHREATYANFVL